MFKISCLDYLKSTIKKRTREFLRDHLKSSRIRFLFIHIKDSQCSRTTMTGNRSSCAGHINVLYSRLPLSDLILNQLDNVLTFSDVVLKNKANVQQQLNEFVYSIGGNPLSISKGLKVRPSWISSSLYKKSSYGIRPSSE